MDYTNTVSQYNKTVVDRQPGPLTDIEQGSGTHESPTSPDCSSIQESGQNGKNTFVLIYVID